MKRSAAVFLALWTVLSLLLLSCGKKENASAPSAGTGVENVRKGAVTEEGFLTCVFRHTAVPLPEGYEMLFSVTPFGDPETGEVTFAAVKRERGEDGLWNGETSVSLFTCSAEGDLLGETETELKPSLTGDIGVVTGDALVLCYGTRQNTALLRWDRVNGTSSSTEEGEVFFGRTGFVYDTVTSDDAGRIYCADRTEVVVLNRDLTLCAGFDFPSPVSSIARGGDGAVWSLYKSGGTVRAARIDPDAGGLGKEYIFYSNPAGSQGSRTLIDAVLPMDCDFCLYDGDAVWAAWGEEDGSVREERIADFANSGIPSFSGLNDFLNEKEGIFPAAVVGRDRILTAAGSGGWIAEPCLWLRAPDVDPAGLKTVVLAHCTGLSPTVIEKIRTFPALHPDARVEVRDYSVYNTDEDPIGGEAQLMFDILNADFHPDIVAVEAGNNRVHTVSERSLVPQLMKRGLLLDLTPWMEKDALVNFGNLFGCMHSFFDDGQGGIWGISPSMSADALNVSPAYVPLLGGKTSWTLGEMFDFFDALPAGTEPFYSMAQTTVLFGETNLLGDGYGMFFDEEDALDRSLFGRFLAYLDSLPKDFQEWKRLKGIDIEYPLMTLMNNECGVYRTDGRSERFYAADHINMGIGVVGYPTYRGSGIRVRTDCAFSLTSYAEDPDLCFDLIRSFFTLDGIRQNMGYYPLSVPFFSLKPLYEEVLYARRWDGSYIYDEPPTQEELAWTYAVLDAPVIPWLEQTPKELSEICTEEVSAYLGGLGTAEECMDKIQSRAALWMAERK